MTKAHRPEFFTTDMLEEKIKLKQADIEAMKDHVASLESQKTKEEGFIQQATLALQNMKAALAQLTGSPVA